MFGSHKLPRCQEGMRPPRVWRCTAHAPPLPPARTLPQTTLNAHGVSLLPSARTLRDPCKETLDV